jgi:hypothetical protein
MDLSPITEAMACDDAVPADIGTDIDQIRVVSE